MERSKDSDDAPVKAPTEWKVYVPWTGLENRTVKTPFHSLWSPSRIHPLMKGHSEGPMGSGWNMPSAPKPKNHQVRSTFSHQKPRNLSPIRTTHRPSNRIGQRNLVVVHQRHRRLVRKNRPGKVTKHETRATFPRCVMRWCGLKVRPNNTRLRLEAPMMQAVIPQMKGACKPRNPASSFTISGSREDCDQLQRHFQVPATLSVSCIGATVQGTLPRATVR